MSEHHSSCKSSDESLIYKCDQCGKETSAETEVATNLQELRSQINRIMNERDNARRQLAEAEAKLRDMILEISKANDYVARAEKAEAENKMLLEVLREVSHCQEGFGEHDKCEESLCGPTHNVVNKAIYITRKNKALAADAEPEVKS